MNPVPVGQAPVVLIRPLSGWVPLRLSELWAYRELIWLLVWRDLKVRYKQTVLGVAWAVLQPFFTMVVFSIFFGGFAKMPSDGVPYPIFAYCALLPWQFFSNAISQSANSVVGNRSLVTKVYFPRIAIPLAAVLGGVVDFGVAFLVLVAMMAVFHIVPTSAIGMLPVFLLLAFFAALATGVWLSALNVRYRDVHHTIPFLTQLWFFATPVVYSSQLVPEQWRALYGFNPMTGVVEGFRWALLGIAEAPWPIVRVSTVVVMLLLVSGLYYFQRMEKTFADII